MKLLLRSSVLLLVALAVCGTEVEQDRRRTLFSSRPRPNILNRRFNTEASATTTSPAPEETTTVLNSRVRLPPRPILRFGLRPPSLLKAKIEQQKAEKEDKSKTETEVISEPQPGQEFVAFVADNASAKVVPESKPEPKILTKPIPGQEFVAFQASHPASEDSVITSEDGEVVFVSADSVPAAASSDPMVEELSHSQDSAIVTALDSILITPDEILPIEESAPATEEFVDDLDEETEKDLALRLALEQEASAVTPSPLKNVTVLEPELETSISVVTSLPTKEVGESMHIEHHMEFEHSHVGPENLSLFHELRENPEFESATELISEADYTELNIPADGLAVRADADVFEEAIVKEEAVTEDPSDTTELPLEAEELPSNIEILSSASKEQQNPPVNDLYGKYFDESNLQFGKGVGNDDKLLYPSETEQKVRSKIEIKEVNGQLYEYEYIYYYDDEYPQYDYESGAPVDVEATTTPAATTTTTPQPFTTTTRPLRSSSRDTSRTRGRRPVVNDQEANLIEEPSRTLDRTRASLTLPARSSRGRGISHNREDEAHNDNTVHSVRVEEDKLPAHTRFPPRSTTPSSLSNRFREPLFKETSQTGINEHKQTPLIPDVTGSHSPVRQPSRSGRTFPEELPADSSTATGFGSIAQEELTTEIAPTSTVSPSSRSLVNLYAFSRAADGEEIADATTQIPQAPDYDTEIPFTNKDYIYDYEDFATAFPAHLESGTESPEPEPAAEPEPEPSTEEPTTSTTTTTTTTPAPTTTEAANSRSRFRARNRETSRFHNRPTPASADKTESKVSNSRLTSGQVGLRRHRPRTSNSVSGLGGNTGNNEPVSANAVESTSEAAEQSDSSRRTPLGNRSRFRPSGGINTFRNRQTAKPEIKITVSPSTASPAKRPSLPSRTGLFRDRFKGRRTTAAEEVSTEPTEEVAAEAPVAEDFVKEVGAVEISTESAVSLATTAVSSAQRTREQSSLNRHRFGVQGSKRNTQQSAATESQDEPVIDGNESSVTQAPRVAPARGRITRPLANRFSSHPSSRNRDTTTLTEKHKPKDETAPEDEHLTEDQPVDHVDEELTEQGTPVEAPEETAQGTQEKGQQPSRGVGETRNIRNRFRDRSVSSPVAPPTKAPKKIEPVITTRRGGLSSLFNRRRKPRPGSEPEEPQTPEAEVPAADETLPIEESAVVDIQQHSEAVPEQVVEEPAPALEAVPEVAEETVMENPVTEEGPKRRVSLFNRLRNRS